MRWIGAAVLEFSSAILMVLAPVGQPAISVRGEALREGTRSGWDIVQYPLDLVALTIGQGVGNDHESEALSTFGRIAPL